LVSYVRFDDFAANRGKSIVADVKTGTGFLSPVDDAKKAVDEVRLLAERAFYIGKRMPFLMNWQLRSAMDETLSDPQVRELTTGLNRATNSMDRLPADIARERAAIFAAFHKEQPFMNQMMMQVRGSLNDGNQLAMNVRSVAQSSDQLLQTVDRLFMAPSRMTPKRGDEKPFDIAEYTKTITALNLALKEANQLVSTGSTLLASQQLDQLATKHVSEATVKGEGVVNVAFWRGVVLMVLFFVLLTVYRLLTHWLNRRART
jgi:hypothetical protein